MKYFFPLLPLLFYACNGETPGNSPSTLPLNALQSDNRPVLYLEGLYATSSAPGKGVEGLFDADPATVWQTQQGAGPDEGIMLYFSKPVALGAVQALPTAGSFPVDSNALLVVYVNGTAKVAGPPGTTIPLDAPATRSLYLRFSTTGLEKTREVQHQDAMVTISDFPPTASIGLQAIRIFDKQNNALRLLPPQRLPGSINASSSLSPVSAYGPDKLFDARKEFAWAEGNAATAGVGEVLHFSFQQPVQMSALQIWNGYQRSDEHFKANTRVQTFTFGLKGAEGTNYTLSDSKEAQKIALTAPLSGTDFELNIRSVYPGLKYKDLAISDLLFYNGEVPFIIATTAQPQNELAMRRQSSQSPLESLLNRPLFNRISEGDVYTTQSLILRSDGTFVLYQTESYGDDAGSETLADGNWELLNADAATASVKIFGKWNNLSQLLEYYQGASAQQVTKIFSDVLTVDAQTVKGQKMVGTFWRR